tara:strand:- start:26 stop:202 length:177 start_codon:yes stop_codon:yes gene_type:complete
MTPYKKGDEAEANTPKNVNRALIDPKFLTPYISAHREFEIFSVNPLESPRPAIYKYKI